MTTIQVQLDDAALARLQREADAAGQSVEQVAARRLGDSVARWEAGTTDHVAPECSTAGKPDAPVNDPLKDLFADDPDVVDRLLDDVMRTRERQQLRMP